ncbi:15-hydroxyprostaglandin dehydrogenase [Trichonephila clavipes]|nr:15-hydroxyprostaglandin dehydrogenase [Trichonephila clavipes]
MEVAVFLFGEAPCLVVVQTFTSSTQAQSTGPVIVTRFFFHMCVFLEALWHVWDFLDRRLAARTLPPVTIRELRLALQDEWAAMPQQLIDTLILSMGRRCETCLANGVVYGTQLAFEHMSIEKGGHGGYIINTASEAGLEPSFLAPVYCATKHAVVGLTKSFGHEYHFKKTGIKVNAVCPGPIETDLCRTFPEKTLDAEEAKKFIASLTTIKPEEVAKALLQLLQDDKNGAFIRIDFKGLRYV